MTHLNQLHLLWGNILFIMIKHETAQTHTLRKNPI
jgi:hypothetical protein